MGKYIPVLYLIFDKMANELFSILFRINPKKVRFASNL
jgi:hypothetical protein